MSHKLTVRKLLLLLLLFGLTSCGAIAAQFGIPQASSIAQIRSNPPISKSVSLQGTVSHTAPMIDQQMYQLKDDSGEIWILTKTTVQQGDSVKVRGTVRFASISIDNQEQGEIYIEEHSRTPR